MSHVEPRILSRGVVCHQPDRLFGYYGWPTVARLPDETLLVGASGPRMDHVCPFGATALFVSRDDGRTWTPPMIVNNSPMDDRDVGLLAMGGGRVMLSWFTLDAKYYNERFREGLQKRLPPYAFALCEAMASQYTPELNALESGSFARISQDGGVTWGEKIALPTIMAPHGPSSLQDGSLLAMGKEIDKKEADGRIMVHRSVDGGHTWQYLADPPLPERDRLFFEPHLIQLKSGKIIAHLRHHRYENGRQRLDQYQTESKDGGNTWSPVHELGVCGSPPHLLEHSSGALLCVYGRREEPFGESFMISFDEGETWIKDLALDWGAPSADLGYPSTVELADGSLYTVYYQKMAEGEPCSLLYTHWRLPEGGCGV